ncbi:hypothetical protein NA57DRAFT_71077 [Rhizodiscina lignyota]|uniref:Uncharacterized protein n=1 Tax=Rhizodiscina lignyota TaxID=1504668 RepID=A0A9P4MGW9_9PEZI|nr:hypothetical protein NA57DRAFT_71077 [Rhizodiscina lignyota]
MESWSQYYEKIGASQLPVDIKYEYDEEAPEILVREVLCDQQSNSYEAKSRIIAGTDIGVWLQNENQDKNDNRIIPALQLVWVNWCNNSLMHIRKDWEEQILNSFNLTAAKHYAGVTRYSFARFEERTGSSDSTKSYLVRSPLLCLIWSYDKSLGRNRGIFVADPWLRHQMSHLLECVNGSTLHHPMFLAEVASMVLNSHHDFWLSAAERDIRPAEARTGFGGAMRKHPPAQKALSELSAQMSGVKVNLAASDVGLAFNKRLNRFIWENLQDYSNAPDGSPQLAAFDAGKKALMASCEATKDRLDCVHDRLDEYVKRADNQLTALFHLITQEDTKASLAIAQESKALAEAAKRDSDSMKSLSLVSMIFLPSTAVASIFAMPFFDWDRNGVNDNFWIYWVTVIPLTILTLLIWQLWIRRQNLIRKAEYLKGSEGGDLEKDDKISA